MRFAGVYRPVLEHTRPGARGSGGVGRETAGSRKDRRPTTSSRRSTTPAKLAHDRKRATGGVEAGGADRFPGALPPPKAAGPARTSFEQLPSGRKLSPCRRQRGSRISTGGRRARAGGSEVGFRWWPSNTSLIWRRRSCRLCGPRSAKAGRRPRRRPQPLRGLMRCVWLRVEMPPGRAGAAWRGRCRVWVAGGSAPVECGVQQAAIPEAFGKKGHAPGRLSTGRQTCRFRTRSPLAVSEAYDNSHRAASDGSSADHLPARRRSASSADQLIVHGSQGAER